MEGMKESGTKHLGTVPISWKVQPFKYCVNICNGREYADIEVEEGGYPVIGSGGEFARASKYCYKGESVLLGRKGTIDRPMYIDDAFWCVDTMFYTQMKRNMCAKYLYYCALNFRFDYYMTSTALPSMTQTDLGSEKICVPSIVEQQAIADFLDDKCSQIDGIISDIEKQIEILKSYKKSLVTETVTKGLYKNLKLKECSFDFAREINDLWKETKIKYICSMYSGSNLTSEEIEEDGAYPVYGGNGLRGYFSDYTNDGEYVIVGRQGALCGNIHLVDGKFWATDHAVVTYLKDENNSHYVRYLFESMNFNQYSQSAAQPGLAVSTIMNLKTAIPQSKETQKEIADYLDDQCAKVDSIITAKQTQLTQMQQHKKSLIYEYVTGKRRVQGFGN